MNDCSRFKTNVSNLCSRLVERGKISLLFNAYHPMDIQEPQSMGSWGFSAKTWKTPVRTGPAAEVSARLCPTVETVESGSGWS